MTPIVVATFSAFLLGMVLTVMVALLLMRRVRDQDQVSRDVNEAVIRSEVESRQREIVALNDRLTELQHRLRESDAALQSARVAEATLQAGNEAIAHQANDLETRLETASRLVETLRAENAEMRDRVSRLDTAIEEQAKQNQEKLALLDQARERLNVEFRSLANEIFESKQKSFREQSQAQLDVLLKPLGEKISDFEKRVENESKERFSLIREVKGLQDLNARISQDAINLTNALKGENKTQGTWGELILERVLERSGLVKGQEYEVQVSLKSEAGKRLQPDVIVHLPESKDVVIDSKVSLVAYERYSSAEDDNTATDGLRAHVQSIRQHVRQLSDKQYQQIDGLKTLDFVLLFVPIEAAFAAAVQHDAELFSDAFDRNIMIVSPSTLLATLRMIHNIWRFEQQNKNAREIADRAGSLYDKFVGFVADLEDIGDRLGAVQTSYDKAHNKLVSGRGNLVGRAEGMKALGAKVSKSLPENLVEMPQREGIKRSFK